MLDLDVSRMIEDIAAGLSASVETDVAVGEALGGVGRVVGAVVVVGAEEQAVA